MLKQQELEKIIAGCRRGSSQCFSQLLAEYAKRCYGYFYRLTGDREASDDLLSELFVKLIEKIKSYRGGSFDGWLFKIAGNIFWDYLRDKQRRKKLLAVKKIELEARSKQSSKHGPDEIDKLQRQLAKLDEDTRQLILLRFYSQVSFRELAAIRGEPIGTTLSKVHRGLKKLRELMDRANE